MPRQQRLRHLKPGDSRRNGIVRSPLTPAHDGTHDEFLPPVAVKVRPVQAVRAGNAPDQGEIPLLIGGRSRTSPPDEEWNLTLIGRIPGSHRLHWADLDGDGRQE